MLYGPTIEEIAMVTSRPTPYLEEIIQILKDPTAHFVRVSDTIINSGPGTRRSLRDTTYLPKAQRTTDWQLVTCTCRIFTKEPTATPRPSAQVLECPHTLAWKKYKRILFRRYQTARSRMQEQQVEIAETYKYGEWEPTTLAAWFTVAEWLATAAPTIIMQSNHTWIYQGAQPQ